VIRGEVLVLMPHEEGTHIVFKLPVEDPEGNPIVTELSGVDARGQV
jgi:hypothetical protein